MKTRNDFRDFLRNALKDKKQAYLKYDELIIDGEIFECDDTSEDIVQVQTQIYGHGRSLENAISNDLGQNPINFTLK